MMAEALWNAERSAHLGLVRVLELRGADVQTFRAEAETHYHDLPPEARETCRSNGAALLRYLEANGLRIVEAP